MCILVVLCSGPVELAAPTSFSVGPNFPTSGANDTETGTQPWLTPGNITVEDGLLAQTGKVRADVYSNYLKGANFGFNIPATATINGIKLEIKIMDESDQDGSGICSDNVVSLVKRGSVQGANRGGHGLSTTALTSGGYGAARLIFGP